MGLKAFSFSLNQRFHLLPCFTVNIISSAGDGFVPCGGVFLVKGVLISSLDRKSVDMSPRCFYSHGQSSWGWSPRGTPGNVRLQQETQRPLLLICWLGFGVSTRESDWATLRAGAGWCRQSVEWLLGQGQTRQINLKLPFRPKHEVSGKLLQPAMVHSQGHRESFVFSPVIWLSLVERVGAGAWWGLAVGWRGPCLVGTWTESPPMRIVYGLVHYRGEE